ncbi:MAG: hypothetical protein MUO26_05030 [Methanotrichaceae archaeon]|nr:hypothetical protein [Methanotrichaceae archaeon]
MNSNVIQNRKRKLQTSCSTDSDIAWQRIEGDHDNSAYRMAELDEVVGDLHNIEEIDFGLFALIGKMRIILPSEMSETLRSLIGKRIGILRCDGYRVRALDDYK